MNTNQKGFASIVLIIALVIILAGGFGYFELTKKTDTPATATTTEQVATQTSQMAPVANKITITAPTTGNVLPSDQQATIRWIIPTAVLDSFPQDFKLGLFLNVQKQGEEGTAIGINDGTNDPRAGSVSWNIPAYFSFGSLKPGVYKIVAYLQAEPRDQSRLCARSINKECAPNEADVSVMQRSTQIKGESGWFTIVSKQNSSQIFITGTLSYVRSTNAVDPQVQRLGVSFQYSITPLCDSRTTADKFSVETGDGRTYAADCRGVVDHVYAAPGTYTARYLRNGSEIATTIVVLQ